MLSLLKRAGLIEEIKAAPTRAAPYSLYGSGGFGGLMGSYSADSSIYYSSMPGAKYDYRAAAGDLLENPVVALCIRAISEALATAPCILQERGKEGQWETLVDDDVTALLNKPMPEAVGYGGNHLWGATAAFECTMGQAFWLVSGSKRGTPAQLEIIHPRDIRIEGTAEKFISRYQILVNGVPKPLEPGQIIHFRAALNHYNPRIGWCPLLTGHRQVAGDNAAATYHGALMRNVSAIGVLLTLMWSPEAARANNVTPAQMDALKRKVLEATGEGAGEPVAINLPVEVKKLGLTPDELALDHLVDYYQGMICALIGVDPMIAGIAAAVNRRTFSNYKEAERSFWERRIQPHVARHSSELGAQLLPLFKLDSAKYRVWRDYSDVEALNENTDEKHKRVDNDYRNGVIDLWTANTEIGAPTEDWMHRCYFPTAVPVRLDEGGNPIQAQQQEGAPADSGMEWTDENDQTLIDGWDTMENQELFDTLPQFTESEIVARAGELGLKAVIDETEWGYSQNGYAHSAAA